MDARRSRPAREAGFSRLKWGTGKRVLLLGGALLVPLLLVGTLWVTGVLALPRLESAVGWTPRGQDVAPSGSPYLGFSIRVDSPLPGQVITEPVQFYGIARPESRVYLWEKHHNVPVIVPTTRTGHWTYTFHPTSLSEGSHTLVFADNDGHAWRDLVERTIQVNPLPELAKPTFIERTLPSIVAQPLLTVFRAAQALLAPITVTITETDHFNLQNDLNQDSVPDWFQQSGVPPDAIPAGLTPIIDSPAWLNLILLSLIVLTPLTILIVKKPELVGARWREWMRLRAKDRSEKRHVSLERHKVQTHADVEREGLRAGSKMRSELVREKARLKKNALDMLLTAARLRKEARLYETQAALARSTGKVNASLQKARLAAESREKGERADVEVQRLRVAEAELQAKRPASTFIRIGRGGFRKWRRSDAEEP